MDVPPSLSPNPTDSAHTEGKAVASSLLQVWRVGSCLLPMDAAGFFQHSLEQPWEHSGAGMPPTRWLHNPELTALLCCQKYEFSLSCASTSELFRLYLLRASFLGILNTQNKSWGILVWHSLSYR